jgi:mono/diheme cytochrome c family protein
MMLKAFVRIGTAALLALGAAMSVAAARPGAMAAPGHLPRWLSETGLYSDVSRLSVDGRNRRFTPQYPLWTDGAEKRRWVRVPAGQTIDAADVDGWSFPVGTKFWKEFAFAGRRVETRMLIRTSAEQWAFASYVWNTDQTDAELAPAAGIADIAEIAPGKRHSIPSVDDCRACHDSNRTEPLGFTALQLSDDRDALAMHAEPPHDDMLTLRTLIDERLLSPIAPALLETAPRIAAPSARARAALGYLSTNCGACHNSLSSLAPLGLQLRQPAYGGGLAVVIEGLQRRTKWDRPGAAPETTRVVDRDTPALSALLLRMKSRRPSSQMPPLGSVIADHQALQMISGWVTEELAGQ